MRSRQDDVRMLLDNLPNVHHLVTSSSSGGVDAPFWSVFEARAARALAAYRPAAAAAEGAR
jgi:hypothetical protein